MKEGDYMQDENNRNFDDIALKAATYPLITFLHRLLNELFEFKSSDADKSALALLEWADRLSAFSLQASEVARTYAESLGYSVGYDDNQLLHQEQDEINLSQ